MVIVKTDRTNAVAGQSGGPTAAINATLAGVIRGAVRSGRIDKIYGMHNGIEGLLNENIAELNNIELSLLENTPAAALGSCRLKLPAPEEGEETYKKIFSILEEYNIKYFFYIGGNDSMDTVRKLSVYAAAHNPDVKIIGVPKTIDNDLFGTDHSPGYGSAAKYIAATIQELCYDNAVYAQKSVLIVEIMGRDAGWLTAAAALPNLCGGAGADLLYLPELPFDDEKFIADIESRLITKPNIVAAVSEGVKYADGRYVCETAEKKSIDIFGNTWLSGTANVLRRLVSERLGCKVRAVELGTMQRCAAHIASLCDIAEAAAIGERAVEAAVSGVSGVMMVFRRVSNDPYKTEIGHEDIRRLANTIRKVPEVYISPEKNGVTRECLEYILPLIAGEPDITYKNGLPVYHGVIS